MIHQTHWLPGIIVGVVGFVVALVVLLSTKRKSIALPANVKLADLEHKVEMLLEQRRALEGDKHQMGAEAFEQEKLRLEQEAAAALKARDAHLAELRALGAAPASASTAPSTGSTTAAAAPQGFWARNQQLKGALWGAGVVLFFVLIGYFLTQAEHDRGNGEITGAQPGMGNAPMQANATPGQQDNEDPHFKMFYDRAKANPQDTEASAYVAHELIRQQRFDEAEKLTNQALAADPFHLESRIHRAVLRATTGQMREAVADLGHLAKTYPDSYEALLFRGAISMQIGDAKTALESFERFSVEAPAEERPPQLDHAMAQLRQQMAAMKAQ